MKAILLMVAGLAAAATGSAQTPAPGVPAPSVGVVDGIVTNVDLIPLPQATIAILGSPVHVATGDNGRFRIFSLPAGRYIFVVHRLGYVAYSTTVEVAANDTMRPSFTLEPVTTSLDTVVIKATPRVQRLAEFDSRRRAGQGKFITAEDIERRHAMLTGDLLRSVLGVQIIDRGGSAYAASTRGCLYEIFIDGLSVGNQFNLSLMPRPEEIAGIEIYTSAATAPMQYGRSQRGCGAILVWTHSG